LPPEPVLCHKQRVKKLCLGLILLASVSISDLALTAELPAETFFRHFQYTSAEISPDGTCIGVLAPVEQRVGLAIVDLQQGAAHWAFSDRTADVRWFRWANTNRLVFGLGDHGHSSAGLLAVNKDGSKPVTLVHVGDHRTWLHKVLLDSPDEILVCSVLNAVHSPDSLLLYPDVERMNLFTGRMTSVMKNPGKVFSWVSDHDGVVRVAIAKEEARFKILYRETANSRWDTLADFAWNEDGFVPEDFEADNRTLIVRARGDGETEALYTYDTAARKLRDLAFRHAEVDIASPIFSRKNNLLGVRYYTERPEVYWFNPHYRALQEGVDRALTNTVNRLINTSRDGSKAIFLASNDRTPGVFYLVDTASGKIKKLSDVAEWIHPEEMCEMRPIQYKARDGLTIHGYLTLPLGSSGKNLPMVVNPHGGPTLRDVWGFDSEVQFLANRGYAVLRVNFRGSAGYGKKFLEAGFKQWGLKQQDDITDGVKWAIDQGIADPKRIAIFGASYGGFAALTGLEKTPELYRCGISYAGVTDVLRTLDSSAPSLTVVKLFLAETIGDLKKDKDQLKESAPLAHVDQIQAPVMLAYGTLDPKVPIATARSMAKQLQKRGKLYTFMEKEDEGHGFIKEANRIEFWKKVDEFLKANLN
jgi:dipeptidyl aminopeptidase/acylaminoacyl peptidase